MKACKVEGCKNKYMSRGYCGTHYQKKRKSGELKDKVHKKHSELCSVDGCESPYYCKDFCIKHYSRFRLTGKTELENDYGNPNRKCTVSGCEKKYLAKGYCRTHYGKMYSVKDKKTVNVDRIFDGKCSIEGCKNIYFGAGYCRNHYCKIVGIKRKYFEDETCRMKDCNKKGCTAGLCLKCQEERKNQIKNSEETGICSVDGCGASEKDTRIIRGYCNMHYLRFQRTGTTDSRHCSYGKSYGEEMVKVYLEDSNYKYNPEVSFSDCKHINRLRFDFEVELKNSRKILIEYDGKQHYEAFNYFGGEEGFRLIQHRDQIKNKFCKDNNIPLLRIKYDNKNIDKTIEDFLIAQEGIDDKGCKIKENKDKSN